MAKFARPHNASRVKLPPIELRNGVTGYTEDDQFLESGQALLKLLIDKGLKPRHRVLEIGCGCGRAALALACYLSDSGGYIGIDAKRKNIVYCSTYIASTFPNLKFQFVNVRHPDYNPEGALRTADIVLPEGAFDFIFLYSLYTVLTYGEMQSCMVKIREVLSRRRGSRAVATIFLCDTSAHNKQRAAFESSFSFRTAQGRFHPEHSAFMYPEKVILELIRESGLELVEPVGYTDTRLYITEDVLMLKAAGDDSTRP